LKNKLLSAAAWDCCGFRGWAHDSADTGDIGSVGDKDVVAFLGGAVDDWNVWNKVVDDQYDLNELSRVAAGVSRGPSANQLEENIVDTRSLNDDFVKAQNEIGAIVVCTDGGRHWNCVARHIDRGGRGAVEMRRSAVVNQNGLSDGRGVAAFISSNPGADELIVV